MTEITATTVTTTDFMGTFESTTYAISGTITAAERAAFRTHGWDGWTITLDGETQVGMLDGRAISGVRAPKVGERFTTTGAEARIKGDGYTTDAAAAGYLI